MNSFGQGDTLNISMPPIRRIEPMPVKYWSKAGIMLSYWCNASCQSCYLSCGPEHKYWASADDVLGVWRELEQVSPHGCAVHITGGEPFGNWPLLIEVARRARDEGIGTLEKVETNGFWATDYKTVHERIRQLDTAGMLKLSISCDPYHQQFVPIERVRMLVEVAEKLLSPSRVQVRWLDYLKEGGDTDKLTDVQRKELFTEWMGKHRDRFTGRAGSLLAGNLQRQPVSSFIDQPCNEVLLRGRHVHVDPLGNIIPGVCAGVCLGNAFEKPVREIWADLFNNYKSRPVLSALSHHGPYGLFELAVEEGFEPHPEGYADKCHLCWNVKCFLRKKGKFADELKPETVYGEKAI